MAHPPDFLRRRFFETSCLGFGMLALRGMLSAAENPSPTITMISDPDPSIFPPGQSPSFNWFRMAVPAKWICLTPSLN
jgi:hypothetical protein